MNIKNISWNLQDVHTKMQKNMHNKQLVLCATDTVLGLLSEVSEQGFEALNIAKKRSEKPYLILIGSIQQLEKFVHSDQLLQIENFVANKWPAPLTVICKAKEGLPHWMIGNAGTVALRMPGHKLLRELAVVMGGLFSTSANITGQAIPTKVSEVPDAILKVVSLIVLAENKELYSVVPSTIVDCSSGKIKVVRQGVYTLKF